jgi:sarcosine oxidase gamma subunit
LRYFDRDGRFAAEVRECTGQSVPGPLGVTTARSGVHDAQFLLAWRSPSETLLLCSDRQAFAALERRLAGAADGCLVDQTGGILIWDVQGRRAVDLLQRMGARTGIPGVGRALGSRMAEVHALTACVLGGDYLLCVERVYAAHLIEWVRTTVADMS